MPEAACERRGMQFDQFARELDSAVRALGAHDAREESDATKASWTLRERRVDVALLAPLNVSVALVTAGQPPVTTWYPIDAALVPVVSRRIAGYLSEA
jgi:hypothetical protein